MSLVFMGTPGFAVPALEYLAINKYDISAVYTRPDKPAGRGRALTPSPVKEAALELGLEVRQPESFKDPAAVSGLAALRPEVIVVSAFGQLLPQKVLDIPSRGCVNIHPSLLPRHRGAAPVAGAIMAGDDFTGVSLMLLDAGMDTGPVLAQAMVPVSDGDDTVLLTEKLSLLAARLLAEALPRWLAGNIQPRPQDESRATVTSLLTKTEGEIDWDRSAADIWRKIRSFHPWPGCYTHWQGRQLKIIEALPLAGAGACRPGTVVPLEGGDAAFGICAGEGVLGVLRLQLEGKKVMASAEFLRGQAGLAGAVMGTGSK